MTRDEIIHARCNSNLKEAAKAARINLSDATNEGITRNLLRIIKAPDSITSFDQKAEKYFLKFLDEKEQILLDELQEIRVMKEAYAAREEIQKASLIREHRETALRMESEERINTARKLQQQIKDILSNLVPEEKRAEIGSYAGKEEVHRKIQVLTKQVTEDLTTEIPPSFNTEYEVDTLIYTMWGGLSA